MTRVAELPRTRRRLLEWALLVLAAEKTVQHVFVSTAFAADWFDLREQVAAPYEILLVSGAIVAALFGVSVIALWRRQRWARPLLIGLALFDIVGEFAGQGTIQIQIVVSFIVAWVILALASRL